MLGQEDTSAIKMGFQVEILTKEHITSSYRLYWKVHEMELCECVAQRACEKGNPKTARAVWE